MDSEDLQTTSEMEAYEASIRRTEQPAMSHEQDEHAFLESSCFMTARASRTPDCKYTYNEIAGPLYRVEPLYGAVLIQRSTHTYDITIRPLYNV